MNRNSGKKNGAKKAAIKRQNRIDNFKKLLKTCPYAILFGIFMVLVWGKQAAAHVQVAELKDEPAVEVTEIEEPVGEVAQVEKPVSNETKPLEPKTGDSIPVDASTDDALPEILNETSDEEQEAAPTVTEPKQASPDLEAPEPEAPADTATYPYSMGHIVGTRINYEPVETDSPYYCDMGQIALSTSADYIVAGDDYFKDACFIGDSRMLGVADYSGFEGADFYCDNGYCIHSFVEGQGVTFQENGKKYKLEDILKTKQYKKIYLMLGVNDCGYYDFQAFKDNYSAMLKLIEAEQPDARIFLLSNLHISRDGEKNDKTDVYRNININAKNLAISELADGVKTFYLDINPLFVDSEGYLIDGYTFDGFHVYAEQYIELADFIRSHAL